MIDPKEYPIMQKLTQMQIPFERFEHDAAMTMQDCELFNLKQDAAHCKNIFLCNRQGTQFYLLLIAGGRQFQTKEISKQLGVSRLSFGSPEQLQEKLGLTPGAVTPMGILNNTEHDVQVLLDKDLRRWENVLVHPNVNTASIMLKTADLLHFLNAMGNRVVEVEVAGQAQ